MEENVLELWKQIELTKKKIYSPDISSCQEANSVNTIGQTQPPTPLSASLASSDGGAFMSIDPRDLRNLQVSPNNIKYIDNNTFQRYTVDKLS